MSLKEHTYMLNKKENGSIEICDYNGVPLYEDKALDILHRSLKYYLSDYQYNVLIQRGVIDEVFGSRL